MTYIPVNPLNVSNISGAAPLNSPILTGTPVAPTAPLGTITNQIATMAAVKASSDALIASIPGTQPIALTETNTIIINGSLSTCFTLTLTGNRTLSYPTNLVPGREYTLSVYQDSVGSRTLSFDSRWKFSSEGDSTLSSSAMAIDLIFFKYDGQNLLARLDKNFNPQIFQVFGDEFTNFFVRNGIPPGVNKLRNSAASGAVTGTPGTTPDNWQFSPANGISLSIINKGDTTTSDNQTVPFIDIRFLGTLSAQGNSYILLDSPVIPVINNETWTISGWFSLINGSNVNVNNVFLSIIFNDAAGNYVNGTNTALGVVPGALTRFSVTQTAGTGAMFAKPYWFIQNAAGAVDVTVRVAGFQVEKATTPSTYNRTSSNDGIWDTAYFWGPTVTINNEQQYYVDVANNGVSNSGGNNPFNQTGSVLTITGDHAPTGTSNSKIYTSGVITTRTKFSRTYGYIEASLKLPKGQGLWPAFWLLPRDISPNTAAELDILESIGDTPLRLYTTVHYGNPGQQQQNYPVFPNDPTTSFNTYGLNWQSDNLTWYYNRAQVFTSPTPNDCKAPFYLLCNLALGGSFPGNVVETSPSQVPATLQIDYIRWWNKPPF